MGPSLIVTAGQDGGVRLRRNAGISFRRIRMAWMNRMKRKRPILEYRKPVSTFREPDTRTRWPVGYIAILIMALALAFAHYLDIPPRWARGAAVIIIATGVVALIILSAINSRREKHSSLMRGAVRSRSTAPAVPAGRPLDVGLFRSPTENVCRSSLVC